MSRRMRLALASGGIAVALVILMVTAIRAASTYYYTLPQFRALGSGAVGRYVQVNGTVGGAPQWNAATQQLVFSVLPPAPASGSSASASPAAATALAASASPAVAAAPAASVESLPVVYNGPEPDAFNPGISVVVAGTLGADGTFKARQVLVKCPSHYTAAPPGQDGAQWSKP